MNQLCHVPFAVMAAACALVAGSGAPARGADGPATRQWEYKVITTQGLEKSLDGDRDAEKSRAALLQKRDVTNEEINHHMFEYALNKLGRDGWELVNMTPMPQGELQMMFIFKRIRQQRGGASEAPSGSESAR